jgi:hypothetical protein
MPTPTPTSTPNTNANTTNNGGTTTERNNHDNDNNKGHWRQMDNDSTPPRFKCGRVFFHSFDTFPLPLHILRLFFIYCATYMLAHRPLPVRSFILGLEYCTDTTNSSCNA